MEHVGKVVGLMSADACPDAVFSSSNREGVADLMPSMQGDFFDTPLCWGSVRRVGDFRGRSIRGPKGDGSDGKDGRQAAQGREVKLCI